MASYASCKTLLHMATREKFEFLGLAYALFCALARSRVEHTASAAYYRGGIVVQEGVSGRRDRVVPVLCKDQNNHRRATRTAWRCQRTAPRD